MGQGGAGALAAWAKQLGRSVRGGWVNENILVVMLSWELAAGFERAPIALSDRVGHVGPARAIGPGLRK